MAFVVFMFDLGKKQKTQTQTPENKFHVNFIFPPWVWVWVFCFSPIRAAGSNLGSEPPAPGSNLDPLWFIDKLQCFTGKYKLFNEKCVYLKIHPGSAIVGVFPGGLPPPGPPPERAFGRRAGGRAAGGGRRARFPSQPMI